MEESANLEKLRMFVEDLNSTNSTLTKNETLKKYADDEYIKNVLLYTYDPFRKYYVTPANLEKNSELLTNHNGATLFELLDDLNNRKYTGFAAIGRVNSYVTDNFIHAKYVHLILDRNLKIRMDVSQINKVFGNMIPTFEVALANTYKKTMSEANARGKKSVDFENDIWMGSRKLDGCRCICIIDSTGESKFYTRKGHEILTLGILADEIRKWGLSNVVFDGEMCIMLPDGKEDFKAIMQQIRRIDCTIPNPKYNVFDMLTLDEFKAESGNVEFVKRLAMLESTVKACQDLTGNTTLVNVLLQGRIKSPEHLTSLTEIASKYGWEGVMIRKNVPYAGKRSNDLLKVKEMCDAEYEVVDLEIGDITSTFYKETQTGMDVEYDESNNKWVASHNKTITVEQSSVTPYSDTRPMVSKLVIIHKGNPVGVGSGLSMAQRQEWFLDRSKIIGKTVTIQYFHETEVDGRMSLRFPVLKYKYDGERDV